MLVFLKDYGCKGNQNNMTQSNFCKWNFRSYFSSFDPIYALQHQMYRRLFTDLQPKHYTSRTKWLPAFKDIQNDMTQWNFCRWKFRSCSLNFHLLALQFLNIWTSIVQQTPQDLQPRMTNLPPSNCLLKKTENNTTNSNFCKWKFRSCSLNFHQSATPNLQI